MRAVRRRAGESQARQRRASCAPRRHIVRASRRCAHGPVAHTPAARRRCVAGAPSVAGARTAWKRDPPPREHGSGSAVQSGRCSRDRGRAHVGAGPGDRSVGRRPRPIDGGSSAPILL